MARLKPHQEPRRAHRGRPDAQPKAGAREGLEQELEPGLGRQLGQEPGLELQEATPGLEGEGPSQASGRPQRRKRRSRADHGRARRHCCVQTSRLT